jgi:glycosyltransferase involved in cell wall biosynthesis
VLLQALAHKKAMFNSWVFLVIGDGPDKHSLEVMIKDLGLGHKVRLLPWQDNLSLVYSAIDMLLLPSRFEGVPVTMLEAMYCRLPIVSSNIPPITEFLPKEWLFPVGDSRALVDTMLRVRSVDNRQLLEDNRQLISARFTQERQKEEFGRVLSRCMVSVSETNMK